MDSSKADNRKLSNERFLVYEYVVKKRNDMMKQGYIHCIYKPISENNEYILWVNKS